MEGDALLTSNSNRIIKLYLSFINIFVFFIDEKCTGKTANTF